MSYLDEISGGGYYLNAFNNLLKRRQMENAAQNQMQAPMQNQMENQMMGGGGDGRSSNPSWDALSNAQKAGYYRDNPTMAAITQGLQKGFGMTSYGMLQNALAPDFVREQQAIAQGFPDVEAYSGSRNFGKESSLPAEGVVSPGMPQSRGMFESLLSNILPSSNVTLDPAPVETREATPNPYGPVGLYGDAAAGTTSSYGGGGDAPGANADGFGGGDAGFGGGSQAFNQGGMVTPERLMGRAPAPDDGYGALQGGEYVITKAAVERYGKAMMDAINNGTFR